MFSCAEVHVDLKIGLKMSKMVLCFVVACSLFLQCMATPVPLATYSVGNYWSDTTFNKPNGVWFDKINSKLYSTNYVTSPGHGSVKYVDGINSPVLKAGSDTISSYVVDGNQATSGSFYDARGVVGDSSGNLFVMDYQYCWDFKCLWWYWVENY